MGFAMLQGWIHSGALAPNDVTVVEPNESLRQRAAALGVATFPDSGAVATRLAPHLIVIAVKPQVMATVLPDYKRFEGATFVSIAAGIGTKYFLSLLGENTPVIRCMPNTPAAIGKGMLVYCQNTAVAQDSELFVRELLSKSGRVAKIDDEKLIDAVTAVSGSGPAYVFHFIECLTEAGVQAGLPREIASELAMQTVMGAGVLASESKDTPTKLREQVTSPNGTTAAALAVFMEGDRLKSLVGAAVEAARKRSIELGA